MQLLYRCLKERSASGTMHLAKVSLLCRVLQVSLSLLISVVIDAISRF